LGRRFSKAQRRELAECLRAMDDPKRELDRVLDTVRTQALRAGLLACGDLRAALRLVLGEYFDLASVVNSQPALALLRFWVSTTFRSLRQQLGQTP
jgi:hypothetical protein